MGEINKDLDTPTPMLCLSYFYSAESDCSLRFSFIGECMRSLYGTWCRTGQIRSACCQVGTGFSREINMFCVKTCVTFYFPRVCLSNQWKTIIIFYLILFVVHAMTHSRHFLLKVFVHLYVFKC